MPTQWPCPTEEHATATFCAYTQTEAETKLYDLFSGHTCDGDCLFNVRIDTVVPGGRCLASNQPPWWGREYTITYTILCTPPPTSKEQQRRK